ncbi:hypothetical protein [Pseudomonas monteilii]|uniref:hypothetical protein n=1 Tax=Pseudomonas monteilii TaxID=76759 RepID=UPI00383AE0A0
MYNFDSIKSMLANLSASAKNLQLRLHDKNWTDDELIKVIRRIEDCQTQFNHSIIKLSFEDALRYAGKACSSASEIVHRIEKYPDPELSNTSRVFQVHVDALMALLAPTALPPHPLSEAEIQLRSEAERLYREELEKLQIKINENERQDERQKKIIIDNEVRMASLEQRLIDIEHSAQTEIDKIIHAYSEGEKTIVNAKKKIDDLLVLAGKDVVAGDYTESAAAEKRMADNLRNASLFCMAIIALALGYSFWETTTIDFDWKRSLFRIGFAFMLSVPAAYLARESAKHRQQQYEHLQTSLDLKAISPFVASLPEDEQHKIKILIASKVFAGRDFSKVGADPYPINTHELIMEIIKKLDVSSKANKPES